MPKTNHDFLPISLPDTLIADKPAKSIPIWLLSGDEIETPPSSLPKPFAAWMKAVSFKPGNTSLVTGPDGTLAAVLFSSGKEDLTNGGAARKDMGLGKLARTLPAGCYHLEGSTGDADLAALSWLLGGYRFDRYLNKDAESNEKGARPVLVAPMGCDLGATCRKAEAVYLTRNLVNTPTCDLGPNQLEEAFCALAGKYQAGVSVIHGDDLLAKNFPMVHAVGRASVDAPRLLDMTWGRAGDAKVTLVGKGVCFDTGGLNIKPGSSMAAMKKDMGGAANVMGLASMIMDAGLPVRLRVIVPAVENSISGNAFRPGDILPSRKGISVEIGNTDAEGRLILGDALALADEEKPDMLIDMATLTGAARVALGPELPPFYTADDQFAGEVAEAGLRLNDPVWRMPLWAPYQQMLSSTIADINHISTGGFAGSITAALFLQKFVENAAIWAHFDIFASVAKEKPWAPLGGEAQAIRALFDVLQNRYPV